MDGMFGLSDVVEVTKGAGDDVHCIGGGEGE